MPLVSFARVGNIGQVSDIPAHELPPTAWTDTLNMRFMRDKAERFGGSSTFYDSPSIPPYSMLAWDDATTRYLFYANASAIWRTNGVSHTNVTRAAGAYSAGTYPRWNGGVLGGVPILNNNGGADPPQMWDAATTKFANLSNWPASTTCRVLRPFKQYLIALDVTESSNRYPTQVRWSHPADPGTVPISWDIADRTKDAGTFSLSETTGFLVDCLTLGDVNIVYKEDSTWYMRHTGTEFIFQVGNLFRNQGLLAPDCVKEFNRRHFVVGIDDVWVHDGQSSQSVIAERMKDAFFADLSTEHFDHTFVITEPRREEIFIFYPEQGEVWPNKALVWNWRYNTWGIRELEAPVAHGILIPVTSNYAEETFDSGAGVTFTSDTGTFGDRNFTVSASRIGLAEPGSVKFRALDTSVSWGGNVAQSYVERTGLTIVGVDRENRPIVDQENVKFVRRVYPHIRADAGAVVKVYVGAQNHLNEPVRWYGPYNFNPSTQNKVDCTVSGRYIGVRFKVETNHWWELEGYKLDIDLVGVH